MMITLTGNGKEFSIYFSVDEMKEVLGLSSLNSYPAGQLKSISLLFLSQAILYMRRL